MSAAEKCPLEDLLQALSQMDQAAIQQEKLNAKLQAENELQACELGRLQSELSTRPRLPPSTAAASPAVPAPGEARPPAPSEARKSGCVMWLWAMAFCLLLMGFYQASAFGQLQRYLQRPSESSARPSRTFSESKVSHANDQSVHHLRVQSAWESNGSGDELTMITPAPSKSLRLGSTADSTANLGYADTLLAVETAAQVDKAEETREADATPPLEERQPDLMSEEQVEAKASATEEPETAAQVDKAEETREADATPPLEERQPDLMSEEQVEAKASATEEPETRAQVDKAEDTIEADALWQVPSATKEDPVFLDEGMLSLCDTHLMGSSWKKTAHCNATPWPCGPGLVFLGGSRTTAPDCGAEEEPSLESWSLPSMQVFSEKLLEKEELIEHSLGAAIGLLAGAWCFW